MATTGPETSSIAICGGPSLGDSPLFDMVLHASTTTIASSTTRPMAKHHAHEGNGVDADTKKGNMAKVPDERHRNGQRPE